MQAPSVTFYPPSFPADGARSIVIANPRKVLINGSSHSTITVTLLDSNGTPVQGRTVALTAQNGSSIISNIDTPVSDVNGQVSFRITNTKAETVRYQAIDMTDNITILQTSSITFILPKPRAPRHFRGKIKKNKFCTQTEIRHVLTWKESKNSEIKEYRIYNKYGKLLLKKSPKHKLKHTFHKRHEHKHYTYLLVAVKHSGKSSSRKLVL